MVAVPMNERVNRRWSVGPYEFAEVEFGRGHPWAGRTMYRYTIEGERVDAELYPSLDRALVSAVGARHMGPRGAGGNAVGTAADWFCVMIGLVEPDLEAPAEPEPGKDEVCPGAGQSWITSTNAPNPSCRSCGISYQGLGVDRPQVSGYHHLGTVPEHAPA
jgi:hypothetical protein